MKYLPNPETFVNTFSSPIDSQLFFVFYTSKLKKMYESNPPPWLNRAYYLMMTV